MRAGEARPVPLDAAVVRMGLLELSQELHGAVDAAGRLRYVNAALAESLGATADALLGASLLQQVAPEDRPLVQRRLGEAQHAQEPVAWECGWQGKAGLRHVAWRARPQPESGLLLLCGQDVTPAHQAAAEADAKGRLLQAICDTLPHSLVVKDCDSRYVMGNRAWAERYGVQPESLIGRSPMHMTDRPEAERRNALELDRLALASGQPRVESDVLRTATDGSTHVLHTWRSPLRDATGQVIGLVSISEDITQRRAEERALQASERRFRTLIEGSIQGVVILRGRKPFFANTSYARIFGFDSPEQIMALDSVDALVAPQEVARQTDYGKARLRGEPVPEHYEFEGLRRDGTPIWLDCIVGVVEWEGSPAVLATLFDITERKRTEQQLRANQRLLRLVLDSMPHNVFVKDLNGRYVMANRAMADFHRLALEDMPGRRIADLPGPLPEQIAVLAETDRQLLAADGMMEWTDIHISNAAGEERIHWVHKVPLRDDQGRVEGIVCVSEDVTELKRAEEELRASQHLLRLVMDAVPHNVYVKDLEGRFLIVNRAMAEFHAVTPESMVGKGTFDMPAPRREQVQHLADMDLEVLQAGHMLEWSGIPVTNAAGKVTIRRLHKLPLRDATGRIQGIVGISEDITEEQRIHQELRASHRLLRTVIDAIPSVVSVKDLQRRYVLINRSWVENFGATPEQALGRTIAELGVRSAEVAADIERFDDEILVNKRAFWNSEYTTTLPDGSHRTYLTFRARLLDDANALAGVVAAAMEVTDLKRVEEEVRSSRQLLQTVFDMIPFWVYVKDRQGRMVMVNRRMADDHGVRAEEVARTTPPVLSAAMSAEQRELDEALDRRVLEGGAAVERPAGDVTLPGGETRRYRTVRSPLRNDAGEITGIVGISEDITERERAQHALQQTQKLESLGVLAGGIAHDFNNLLVSVLGYAHLASIELPSESPVQPLVRQIETAGRRASELCNQLLAYAGQGSFQVSRVQLNDLIREMTELIRVSLTRNIHLQFDFAAGLPELDADATQLRQVVMNLVINAAEAIGERSGAITIRTGVRRLEVTMLSQYVGDPDLPEGDYEFLEVADTGCGMDAEMLSRIFDPFFTTKFSGRGLGLAAVLGIVRGHHGALRVASTPGAGTTFCMLLPPAARNAAATPARRPEPTFRGSGAALVVEDEPAVRELLGLVLQPLGFDVTAVGEGTSALAAAKRLGAALRVLILDVSMPGPSCEETVQAIRAAGVRAPVLIMSGHAEVEVRRRFADVPIDGFISKPFDGKDLQAKLEQMLGGSDA